VMRTLLHLLAVIGGGAILYRGVVDGLPAPPLASKDWGTLAGFGFGALLALVGLRHVWQRLTADDAPPPTGGTAVLLIALAVALTVAAVAWRGRPRQASRECAEVVDHVQELFAAHEGAEAARARFEPRRAALLQRCEQLPSERRRCPLRATSLEEFERCP
jgi:hypothetical protein